MATRYRQLKPRPGSSGQVVAEHQRSRMHAATIELIDEVGYGGLTVTSIVGAAGVSKHTFYENFRDKEDCLLSTYEMIVRHAAREILAARRQGQVSREPIRAGLRGFGNSVAESPKAARLALVAVSGLGDAAAAATLRTSGLFEALLADSFAELDDDIVMPPLLLKGVIAGISQIARSCLLAERERELPGFADELTDWVFALRCELTARTAIDQPVPRRGPTDRKRSERRASANRAHARPPGDERKMILSAAIHLAAKKGYTELTVTRIRTGAGVSRRSFEEHFSGVTDCFLAALELLVESLIAEARDEYLAAENWLVGIHRATSCVCDRLARDPVLVRLGFVELLEAGVETLPWSARLVSELAALLRSALPPDRKPTQRAAEASMAAALALLHHQATKGRPRQLPSLAGTLVYLMLAPTFNYTDRRPGTDWPKSLIWHAAP